MAWLNGMESAFLARMIAVVLAGLAIGIERESRGKAAGISTNMMVIGGSAIFCYLSGVVDPFSLSRIAAAVVTGVGFLGAGIILKGSDGVIRNLTTAASIWFSAAVGMLIGYGWYVSAFVAVVFAVLVPRIPHFNKKHPALVKLRTEKERYEEDI